MRLMAAIFFALLTAVFATQAQARHSDPNIIICDNYGCSDRPIGPQTATYAVKRHRATRLAKHRRERTRAVSTGLETIQTAANLEITVAADFAPKIQGFIADLVARGYHPHQIHCYATGGHVHHSLHYSGHACDFDQRGWGKTASPMYHVADLCRKWGLRDGGEFRDWGHIDSGGRLTRQETHPPFYGATADFQHKHRHLRYARR